MEFKFTSDITVTPIQHMGGDTMVAAAAKVSTTGEEAKKIAEIEGQKGIYGLINYLMKHRHGTPFEHNAMTFFVHAPIFVWREWHRHRVGFSYNEESGRYKQLEPTFWIPRLERGLVPVPDPGMNCPECNVLLEKIAMGIKYCRGCDKKHTYHASARPCFQAITPKEHDGVVSVLKKTYIESYSNYHGLVEAGIAKEVARAILPVGIFSSCWVTTNARALMHFLSLRTHDENAMFISYPQSEIEEAARATEEFLKVGWPLTYKAFIENGRVGP